MSKISDFLAYGGIYSSVEISIQDFDEVSALFNDYRQYTFDWFCNECKSDTVFHICSREAYEDLTESKEAKKGRKSMQCIFNDGQVYESMPSRGDENEVKQKKYNLLIKNNELSCLTARCARDENHECYIFVILTSDRITKIGQFPNPIKSQFRSINKYKGLLDNYMDELKTALALSNNNVGVGSYVYLRRVFEKIVFDVFNENKTALRIDDKDFFTARFDEKIDILKDYLPKFLVENRAIYGILSKGVHELDEEDCNEYFPVLYKSITMILDEIIEKKKKLEEQKGLANSIAKIKGKLK